MLRALPFFSPGCRSASPCDPVARKTPAAAATVGSSAERAGGRFGVPSALLAPACWRRACRVLVDPATSPAGGLCADQSCARPAAMRAAVAAAALMAISDVVGGVNLSIRRRLRTSSASGVADAACGACGLRAAASATSPAALSGDGDVCGGVGAMLRAPPFFSPGCRAASPCDPVARNSPAAAATVGSSAERAGGRFGVIPALLAPACSASHSSMTSC